MYAYITGIYIYIYIYIYIIYNNNTAFSSIALKFLANKAMEIQGSKRDKVIVICSWYNCLFRKPKKFYRTDKIIQQDKSYKTTFKNK